MPALPKKSKIGKGFLQRPHQISRNLIRCYQSYRPQNLSSAETSIEAWRELAIPADTDIEEKERYWNGMVYKLFDEFNKRMEQNIYQYLNMYVANNSVIQEYN